MHVCAQQGREDGAANPSNQGTQSRGPVGGGQRTHVRWVLADSILPGGSANYYETERRMFLKQFTVKSNIYISSVLKKYGNDN